jgi:hypothetical protein
MHYFLLVVAKFVEEGKVNSFAVEIEVEVEEDIRCRNSMLRHHDLLQLEHQ